MKLGKEPPDQAIGRSRGGLTSKLHMATDGKGRMLSAGNINGSSWLRVSDGCSCRCSGGTAQQDTRFIVACVGESPACPFYVLDRGVIGFHFRRCRTGDNEDFDLFPPPGDRAPEPVDFGLRGLFDQGLQRSFAAAAVTSRTVCQETASWRAKAETEVSKPCSASVAHATARAVSFTLRSASGCS
jgi:hypothetical protein